MEPALPRVLTVDDDPDLTAIIELHIRRWGYESHSVGSGDELWAFLDRSTPDAMLLDVLLGDDDGSEIVAQVKRRLPDLPVIMITRSLSFIAPCAAPPIDLWQNRPHDRRRMVSRRV